MKNLFLAWVWSVVVILGGAYFAFEAGFFHYIYDADVSKLCFVIIVIFLAGYSRLGYLVHRHGFKDDGITSRELEIGFELADISMAVGMLGTVIGFIVMSSSFVDVDFSNVENIKDLFKLATEGMSTALYTTAFGLVSSITLRSTYFAIANKLGH